MKKTIRDQSRAEVKDFLIDIAGARYDLSAG